MSRALGIAIVLVATLQACSSHESHVRDEVAGPYIATLPTPEEDPRVHTLIGFVRTADGMLSSSAPVETHVDEVTLRQSCMQLTYGIRGSERRKDAVEHLLVTPERQKRWWRYIEISSSRGSVRPSELECAS